MAYVRKAERKAERQQSITNETGVELDGITPEQLIYCNILARVWKNKLEAIPGTKMVKVGTFQGLLEMGQTTRQDLMKVLKDHGADHLIAAHGYIVTFGHVHD